MVDFEYSKNGYLLSTNKALLDIHRVHHWLSEEAYWSLGRSLEVVSRSIEHSLCIGIYQNGKQAAFARLVTDYATFAWLCDVFIDTPYRGRGLGKWIVETITQQPEFINLRRMLLATRDAHGLYQAYGGFQQLASPDRWMERFNG